MVHLRLSVVLSAIGTLAALLLLCLNVAAPAVVPDAPPIVGDWIGTLRMGQQGLRIALHVNRDASGDFTVTIDSPDQKAFDPDCDQLIFRGGQLSFRVPTINAIYWGTLSPDGRIVAGE